MANWWGRSIYTISEGWYALMEQQIVSMAGLAASDDIAQSHDDDILLEVVYAPESELRRPFKMLGAMFKDLLLARELAWRLFVRDVSAQYRQSVLGYRLAYPTPLVSMAVWVFSTVDECVSRR